MLVCCVLCVVLCWFVVVPCVPATWGWRRVLSEPPTRVHVCVDAVQPRAWIHPCHPIPGRRHHHPLPALGDNHTPRCGRVDGAGVGHELPHCARGGVCAAPGHGRGGSARRSHGDASPSENGVPRCSGAWCVGCVVLCCVVLCCVVLCCVVLCCVVLCCGGSQDVVLCCCCGGRLLGACFCSRRLCVQRLLWRFGVWCVAAAVFDLPTGNFTSCGPAYVDACLSCPDFLTNIKGLLVSTEIRCVCVCVCVCALACLRPRVI